MESELSSVGCTIIINGDYIEVGNSPSRMCIWTFEPKLDNDDTLLCKPNSVSTEGDWGSLVGSFQSQKRSTAFSVSIRRHLTSRTIKQPKFILKGHFDCVCRMTQSK